MPRRCACDCGELVEGRAKYRPGHRQRAYARKARQAMVAAGLPPHASLKAAERAAGVHATTSQRKHDASNAEKQSLRRSRKRSGRQLTLRKAERAAIAMLRHADSERIKTGAHRTSEDLAREYMVRELPMKQREAA